MTTMTTTTTMRPSRVTFSLPTSDRRRAFDFYRKGLGLRLATDAPEGKIPEPLEFALDTHTHLMLVPTDGLKFVLGDRPIAGPDMSECVIGLSFATNEEVDGWVERALAAGATVLSPPKPLPWGYSANLRDPDGHVWMLVVPRS